MNPGSTSGLAVYPGQHLDASAWVKTSGFSIDGDTDSPSEYGAVLKLHFWDADGVYLGTDDMVRSGNFADSDTGGTWQQISTQATVPDDAYFARMNIEYLRASGTLYVDDAYLGDGEVVFTDGDGTVRHLSQVADGAYTRDPLTAGAGLEYRNLAAGAKVTTPELSMNDAPDPGFEKSLATGGWYVSNSGITFQQTSVQRSGSGALKFYAPSFTSGYISPCSGSTATMMPCSAGDPICASMWINTYLFWTDTSKTERGSIIKLHYYNSSGTYIGSSISPSFARSNTNGWRQVEFSDAAPTGAAYVKFNLEYRYAKGTMYVDDVELGHGTIEADRSTDGLCSSTSLGYDMIAADANGGSYLDYDLGDPQVLSSIRLGLWDFQVIDPPYEPGPGYTYRVVVADTQAGLDSGTEVVPQTSGHSWVEHDFDPIEARFVRVYAYSTWIGYPFRLMELELPQWRLGHMPVVFDDDGKLIATGDESGNITIWDYDAQGRVSGVSEEAGRSIVLDRDASGRLGSFDWHGIDSDGDASTQSDRVAFTHTATTTTVRADDGSGLRDVVEYGYDNAGRISSITDADDVEIDISYDSITSKVTTVTYADGSTRHYDYSTPGQVDVTLAGGGDSLVSRTSFDTTTGLVTATVADPAGLALETVIAYDSYGHVRSVTDPEDNTTTTYADAHGNVLWTDEAGERVTKARYEDDLVQESRDAKDNVSSYQYDEARRILSASQAISEAPADEDGGEAASYSTYDGYGNQLTGNLPGSTSVNLASNSTFEKDPLTSGNGWDGGRNGASWRDVLHTPYMGDHYVRITSPSVSSYITSDRFEVNDENTYAVSAIARGSGIIKIDEYDKDGNDITTRYPVVFSSSTSSPLTRVSGMYWPHEGTTEVAIRVWSAAGDLVDIDNIRVETATAIGGENFVENASFESVSGDLPTTWQRRSSSLTTAEHSASDDMAISGACSARIKTFDGNSGYFYSDWIPVNPPDGSIPGEEYSVSGYMKTSEVESYSGMNVIWWDSNKSYLSRSPIGSTSGTTDWQRYVANVTVPAGAYYARLELVCGSGDGITYFDAVAMESARGLELFDYDDETGTYQVAADSVTEHRSTTDYDARGRVTETAYEAEPGSGESTLTAINEFDGEGRLATVTVFPDALPQGDITTSYAYTAAGRLWKVTDPLGRVYEMDYDEFGRLASVKDPLGYYSRTTYDGLGRVGQVMRPSLSATSSVPMTTNHYDAAGRSSSVEFHDATGTVVATRGVRYDDSSRVTSQTLSYGGETYQATTDYDVLNRPVSGSSTGPAGPLSFATTYDKADLPLTSSWTAFGGSESVEKTWAKTNELKTTRLDSSSYTWYFAFDISGALTRAGGGLASHMRSYDTAGSLTDVELCISEGDNAEMWARQSLTRDSWERIDSVSTDFATGTDAVDAYDYDAAGRLVGWDRTGFGASSAEYGYDLAGNLVSKTLGGQSTVYSVNDANQLTSSVSGAVTTDYAYDELGRLVATDDGSVETSYTWNDLGQLAQIADGQTTSTYAYGIDGMRQMKVVDDGSTETTTFMVWSGTKLVCEYDMGAQTRYDYLYGPDGIPLQLLVTRPSGRSSYAFQVDSGGSVIGLTDSGGTEIARYAYDPYGNVMSVSGTAPVATRNPLRYRGYYLDSETGLYYLPARYYDPAAARFISVDPAPPSAGSPGSLNRYAYCMADPVQGTDPTGAIADIDGDGRATANDYAARAVSHARSWTAWWAARRRMYDLCYGYGWLLKEQAGRKAAVAAQAAKFEAMRRAKVRAAQLGEAMEAATRARLIADAELWAGIAAGASAVAMAAGTGATAATIATVATGWTGIGAVSGTGVAVILGTVSAAATLVAIGATYMEHETGYGSLNDTQYATVQWVSVIGLAFTFGGGPAVSVLGRAVSMGPSLVSIASKL